MFLIGLSSQHLCYKVVSFPLRNYKIKYFASKALVSQGLGVRSGIITPVKSFVTTKVATKKMLPKRIISYEDMLKVIHQPEKLIIDVRNPEEIHTTGQIPSSINIPLGSVESVLSMPEDEFKKQFKRPKPSASDELIFYCQSGRRSSEALDKALSLGYSKSKTYMGSWNEWSSKQS